MQRPKIGNAEGARSAGLFRYADGLWPNAAVLTYIVTAWCSAFPLAASGAMALNAAAVLAWVSALTLAAYMIHECVHNTIFASHAHNARLGRLLSWLVGACYTPFAAIADRHLVHHVARIDNVSFDYRVVLQRRPALATCIRSLEACYVPAVDIWMHFAALTAPFREQHLAHLRVRLLCVLAIRVLCFGLWAMWSLKAAICYAIAYVLFIHVLRCVFRPCRYVIPIHVGTPFRRMSVHASGWWKVDRPQTIVKPCQGDQAVFFLRMDSPLSSSRWALCTRRSRIASASVGSFNHRCQRSTGS